MLLIRGALSIQRADRGILENKTNIHVMKAVLDHIPAGGRGKLSSRKQPEFWHFLTFSGLGFAVLIMLFYYCSLACHVHLVPFVLLCIHNVVLMEPFERAILSPVSPGGAMLIVNVCV